METKLNNQVWSFSPPDEAMAQLDRSESPTSMPDQSMADYDHELVHSSHDDTEMS